MSEQYQTFGDVRGASNSFAKLLLLGVPNLKDKSFLDVGCNEGFFCKAAEIAEATKIIGIDIDQDVITRAKHRYPNIDFRCMSWNDLDSDKFDVILFSSAIHYADNQISTIKSMLDRLKEDGLLILELGLFPHGSPNVNKITRSAGDVREYYSLDYIEGALPGFVIRLVGDSVKQAGDPVSRKVLHIRKRKPCMAVLSSASHTGKSVFVNAFFNGINSSDHINVIAVDLILHKIRNNQFQETDGIAQTIREYGLATSFETNNIMNYIFSYNKLEDFISFALAVDCSPGKDVVWEGFIPPEYHHQFVETVSNRGFFVWELNCLTPSALIANDFNCYRTTEGDFIGYKTRRNIRLCLDMIHIEEDFIEFRGWSLDTSTNSSLDNVTVMVGSAVVEAIVNRTHRPDINSAFQIDSDRSFGFSARIATSKLLTSIDTKSLLGLVLRTDINKNALRALRIFGNDIEGCLCEAEYLA
ncbi:class I SAM-dependent methyltransferase [Methylobacterium sp. J-092]|uniref:class I SAM-dependent methyltransferase n=1 Tax=Methylobacterium sp. J-092 TaxID=2836667 RepID=UPI001FBB2EE0|nr:methyltransferase domain-containing protein [Methylobacterium sp. J-092]MCJ2010418.1 class I SAM-dependent methyltransferase [Methylobacterium sp. J-092]